MSGDLVQSPPTSRVRLNPAEGELRLRDSRDRHQVERLTRARLPDRPAVGQGSGGGETRARRGRPLEGWLVCSFLRARLPAPPKV
jgi:hypothetical protein